MTFETINPLTGNPLSCGGREGPARLIEDNLPNFYTITDDPEMRVYWESRKNPARFSPEKYTLGEYEWLQAVGMDPRRTLDYDDAFEMGSIAQHMVFCEGQGVWVEDGFQVTEEFWVNEYRYVYTTNVDSHWEDDGYDDSCISEEDFLGAA
tara:strand:- start:191 stop:643 length:453 start_codon:yes stop_codon:yes gene_type:complete